MAEAKTPNLVDVAGESLFYDEVMVAYVAGILPTCDNGAATESLIMNIEKRDLKMFNTITIIVLAAILLTIILGISIQQQTLPSMGDGMRISRGNNLFQPELAQTGPTGMLALNTGIILLLIGFGSILLLLVRQNLFHHNPSRSSQNNNLN